MRLIDSHAHLEKSTFDHDRADVLDRARQAGLEWIFAIGNAEPEEGSIERALELCRQHPDFLSTTIGIHPHEARICSPAWWRRLDGWADCPEVWAVGEIGLDYHYDLSPRDVQRGVFRDMLAFARDKGKPVVVHSRSADEETLAILEQAWAPPNPGGIMHCFAGDAAMARRCMALGFYISFAGNMTYPKADNLRQAAAAVPLERLLVETDCPYLAPLPYRGKRNEPAYVALVAEAMATIHGLAAPAMADILTVNFKNLFSLQAKEW